MVWSLLLGAADRVSGQEKTATPSAEELWEAYPLEVRPDPGPAPKATLDETRTVGVPVAADESDRGSLTAPLIAVLILVTGGLTLLWTFRSRTGGTSPVRHASSRALVAAPPRAARSAAVPPDANQTWSAEIRWVGTESRAHFSVFARVESEEREQVIAESPSLEWPPSSPPAVQALTAAVAELERSLLDAGWTPLPDGTEWYAKRFTREPAPEPVPWVRSQASQQPAAGSAGKNHEEERAARFLRRPLWPEGSERLWRCEIRWDAGIVNSRFSAIAFDPEERLGHGVRDSATFKWLMMADPDPGAEAFRTELHRLVATLQAGGWEYVGRGPKWYSARFVWRREATPPECVRAGMARASEAS